MAFKRNNKVEVLRMIRENKDILFGAFSEKISKPDKHEKWLEVHNLAKALGLVPHNKDFRYTRDTFWQNIRKNTTKKIDNRSQTGSGGGADCKLTEVDLIVLDIIGKESPIIVGLPVKETWDDSSNLPASPPSPSMPVIPEEGRQQSPASIEVEPLPSRSSTGKKRKSDEDIESLKKKKLKMTIEIMEKESYLKSLQILKLERELCIPQSRFTSDIDTTIYYIDDSVVTNVENGS